jgi:DHA1 family tetracycline resistance protein-like MFS transporter
LTTDGVVQAPVETPAQSPRRAAVVFIFITVLIDVLSFGVVIPVLPHLIEEFLAGEIARAALWVGIFGTVFSAVQFVCTPLQGALSDRYGRRPVILLSNLGLGLDFVLMAVVNTLPLLFLGRVLSGITSASISTANAYIADVTPPEKRAASFGLLGAAFGVGFVLGPALGGYLGEIDLRLPFWVAAGLALANFLYGWFVLPESHPPERRSARIDWRRANPLGAVGLLRSYPAVFGLAVLVLIGNVAHYVLPSTFVLYGEYRYEWGPQQVGLVLGLVGICNVLVQAVLIRAIVPRIGETRALLAGLAFGCAGFAVLATATSGAIALFSLPLLALWGLAGPATQALMTRRVDAEHQGRLQGAVASLASLAGIFAPYVFSQVFASSIGPQAVIALPGAPFYLAALLLLGAFALALTVVRRH